MKPPSAPRSLVASILLLAAIERAVVLTRDDAIGLVDLPLSLVEPSASGPETRDEQSLTAAVEGLERRR